MRRTRLFLVCLALLTAAVLTACGGANADDPEEGPPMSTGGPFPVETPGAGGAGLNDALPQLKLQRVYPNLSFRQMTGMYTAPDGRGRFFVTEQPGRIMAFDGRTESPQSSVFLDITDRVDAGGSEMGLLGLAFAPDFRTSGALYVNYTASSGSAGRRTVISRFKVASGGDAADPRSEEVILEIGQPFPNHNGGQIAFGPDGFLYIGMGDGGSARDPQGHGQNRRSLLGKMLRIDPSGSNGDVKYRVPADNPFANQSAGTRVEIWAVGLRNPWRFSFDSETGALWLADVGQNSREEIDIVTKGGNYGWAVMEGFECLGGGTSCAREGLLPPLFEYPTGQAGNCSVTGGFVYRGRAVAALRGAYVYGDYCSGRVWGIRHDGTRAGAQGQLVDGNFQLSSFAVDEAGELYALQHSANGGIFKLVP